MLRTRRRGQAVVEFGLIALLFVGLLFAVIDFGLLLNTWLAVSSGSRELARSASVGKSASFLNDQAMQLRLPSISTAGFGGGLCCGSTSAVEMKVSYHQCLPDTCPPLPPGLVRDIYPGGTCSGSSCDPTPGDFVKVVLEAHGAQVITPLIRPFFGCSNGVNPNCNVTLSSTTITRFEGQSF